MDRSPQDQKVRIWVRTIRARASNTNKELQ